MLYNPANPAATGGHGSKPGSHREEPAWGCSVDPVATAVNVRVEMRQQQLLALAKATKPVCTVLVAAAVLYLRNAQVCAFVAGECMQRQGRVVAGAPSVEQHMVLCQVPDVACMPAQGRSHTRDWRW